MLDDLKMVWITIWHLLSKPMSRAIYWLYLFIVVILIWGSQIIDSIFVYYWNKSIFDWISQLSQNLFNFYITIFVSTLFIIKQKIKKIWWNWEQDYWENIINMTIWFLILLSFFLIFSQKILPTWLSWIFYFISLICWTISISDDEFINKKISDIRNNTTANFTNNT